MCIDISTSKTRKLPSNCGTRRFRWLKVVFLCTTRTYGGPTLRWISSTNGTSGSSCSSSWSFRCRRHCRGARTSDRGSWYQETTSGDTDERAIQELLRKLLFTGIRSRLIVVRNKNVKESMEKHRDREREGKKERAGHSRFSSSRAPGRVSRFERSGLVPPRGPKPLFP